MAGPFELRVIAAGATVALLLGCAPAASASPDPVVKLKTETQKEALAKRRIAIHVAVQRPSRVRVRAAFSAGVSRSFRLDPQTERVAGDGATFRLPLSRKQRRIIAAAIDVCAPSPVTIRARAIDLAGTPATRREARLRRPPSCSGRS